MPPSCAHGRDSSSSCQKRSICWRLYGRGVPRPVAPRGSLTARSSNSRSAPISLRSHAHVRNGAIALRRWRTVLGCRPLLADESREVALQVLGAGVDQVAAGEASLELP